MKKMVILSAFLLPAFFAGAQQPVKDIFFHLYTDSLKKGFFNYINVDGQKANGEWEPLTTKDIRFTLLTDSANARALYFEGNDLFIDSSYTADSIRVRATLDSDSTVVKETTIYLQKRGFEPLKTEDEIFSDMRKEKATRRNQQ